MWIASDPTVANWVTLLVGALGFAGTLSSAVILSRRGPPAEREAKRKADRHRRRVPQADRITRLESWKDQYADPVLRRVANLLEWDDSPAGENPEGDRDE
jgi:hypothetical protein